MKAVTIHEAKTHLSRLLQRVQRGEELVIARGRTPIARLVPYRESERELGTLTGLIVRMDQSFDDPLDDFAPYMAAEDPR